MWHSRPPPFMAKTILNFHFDYLTPSLIFLYFCGWTKLTIMMIPIMMMLMRMTMRKRRRTLREGSLEEKAAVTNVRTGGAHCLTLITGVPSSSFPSFETEVWSQF